MDYREEVVIATGASLGIGNEAARCFEKRGAIVVSVVRRENLLKNLVSDIYSDSRIRSTSPEICITPG